MVNKGSRVVVWVLRVLYGSKWCCMVLRGAA